MFLARGTMTETEESGDEAWGGGDWCPCGEETSYHDWDTLNLEGEGGPPWLTMESLGERKKARKRLS